MKNNFVALCLLSISMIFSACSTYKTDERGISWVENPRCDGLRDQVDNLKFYFKELVRKGENYAVKSMKKQTKKSIETQKR